MTNLSDKEQADLVKKFWNNWGRYIAVAILVGLLIGFGWRWWNEKQDSKRTQAGVLYNELLQSSVTSTGDPRDPDPAILAAFASEFPASPYRAFAELYVAKRAVIEGQYDKPKRSLTVVINSNTNPSLKDLARIRLVRLDLETGAPKQAAHLLDAMTDTSQWMQVLVSIERARTYQDLGDAAKAALSVDSAKQGFKELTNSDLPSWLLPKPAASHGAKA